MIAGSHVVPRQWPRSQNRLLQDVEEHPNDVETRQQDGAVLRGADADADAAAVVDVGEDGPGVDHVTDIARADGL